MGDRWIRITEVFERAFQLPVDRRSDYLFELRGEDAALVDEVNDMLCRAEDSSDLRLSGPAQLNLQKLAQGHSVEGGAEGDQVVSSGSKTMVGTRVGPFRILTHLGSGGMGDVYLARRDDNFRQEVAIKVLRPDREGNEALLRRFEFERQILADLQHGGIARLFDGGSTDQGQPYFVMEFVAGEPITDYCRRRKLDVRSRLELFLRVSRAVSYAHGLGVIHRDLKPGNILVTPDGSPKLVDFGIATLVSETVKADLATLTQAGQVPYTPAYASPEQIKGDTTGVASDVYSLGVVLYELLAARRPFLLRSRSPLEIVRTVCEQEPPRPSAVATDWDDEQASIDVSRPSKELRRTLREDLDQIVLKAMRKEWQQRYASVDQFADDIQNYFDGRPVAASRGTFNYLASKFLKRHAALVAAASITILALVAGLIATSLALRRANQLAQEIASNLYESDLAMSVQAYDNGNLHGAFQRLSRHGAAKRSSDNPEFEWLYLWHRFSESLQWPVLANAGGEILSIGGTDPTLVFARRESYDQYIRVWTLADALEMKKAKHELKEDRIQYYVSNGAWPAVDYSPETGLLAYFPREESTTLVLADLQTGATLDSFDVRSVLPHGPGAMPGAVSFSSDGRLLATMHRHGSICLWRISAHHKIEAVGRPFGHDRLGGWQILFSPDGKKLASVSYNGMVRVWDVDSLKQRWKHQHHGTVYCICWTNDGSMLISGTMNAGVEVFNATDGSREEPIREVSAVNALAVSPDNHLMAIGGNGMVRIWDFEQRRMVLEFRGHYGRVVDAAFVDRGAILVTTDSREFARFWPMTSETAATPHLTRTSRNAPITRIDGHSKRICRIAFHPSGQYFATVGEDSKTKVWNLHDAGFVREFSMQDPGCDVSFSRDGKLIGTSEGTSGESKTALVRLWDFKSGEEVCNFPHSQSVNFHPTLDWLGCDDAVRDLGTGEPIVTFASEEGIPPIDRVNFANHSPLVAARIGNRFGWRIDEIDQRAVGWTMSRPDAHNSFILSLQFSPDDAFLATGSNDRTVKLWEVRTGELITTMAEHANIVFGTAFHPKGNRLASASADGTVNIWEIPTGKHRLTLKGSPSGMQCVAFSPDGKTLVAGATDGTILIWRAATGDEFQKTLPIVRERYLNTTPHR